MSNSVFTSVPAPAYLYTELYLYTPTADSHVVFWYNVPVIAVSPAGVAVIVAATAAVVAVTVVVAVVVIIFVMTVFCHCVVFRVLLRYTSSVRFVDYLRLD